MPPFSFPNFHPFYSYILFSLSFCLLIFNFCLNIYMITQGRVNQHFHLFVVAINFETWNIHELNLLIEFGNLVLVIQCFTFTTSYICFFTGLAGRQDGFKVTVSSASRRQQQQQQQQQQRFCCCISQAYWGCTS